MENMKLDKNKIVWLIFAILIVAGIVVVALKGFNVSLDLKKHDTLKFIFDQKFEREDVEKVCKEVFKDKKFEVKTVEVFSDAVYVISDTITPEEKDNLLKKLDGLYKAEISAEVPDSGENTDSQETPVEGTESTDSQEAPVESTENTQSQDESVADTLNLVEGVDYDLYTDGNIRLRDVVEPYIVPCVISAIIILIYIAIRYRKVNEKLYMTLLEVILKSIVLMLAVLSIVAIFRVEVDRILIPILIFIEIEFLVLKCARYEKKLKAEE